MPTTFEPTIHGLVGTQFGDNEFDAGKSVRWLQWFTQDIFISDINTGVQRYWVVNWAKSFPKSEHIITGINFFGTPAAFRQEQFLAASKVFHYDPADWVIFIDGHEGMSVDNTSFPDDYNFAPFTSYLWREVTRAVAASKDRVVLPFFVFLASEEIQNITYDTPATLDPAAPMPPIQQAVHVPYYFPYQGLTRMLKVSALLDPEFDWATLDTPATPDVGCKIQCVSYAYAHWNKQDIVAPATTVEPLSADNDLGWEMRNQISRVLPISELPFGTVWQDPSNDPAGLPGPWCVDSVSNVNPPTVTEEVGHTPAAVEVAAIRTPLYDTVFRLNLRDGLWYEQTGPGSDIGNMPLAWDGVQWYPLYDTATWALLGVNAASITPLDVNLSMALQPTTVRAKGSSVVGTLDASLDGAHS